MLGLVHALRLACVAPGLCGEMVGEGDDEEEGDEDVVGEGEGENGGEDEGDGNGDGDGGEDKNGMNSIGEDKNGMNSIGEDKNGDGNSVDGEMDRNGKDGEGEGGEMEMDGLGEKDEKSGCERSVNENDDKSHTTDRSINDDKPINDTKSINDDKSINANTTNTLYPTHSIKLTAVQLLIQKILASTDELLLVISTYTQILDLFDAICTHHHWDFFRLDGSTEITQRQTIVNSFNARFTSKRLFLLSARAGGVGLNITGASRVILLEPAWNPAVDAQSIARSWRFGQQRHVFVYRFFLSGTIEEVILQRQLLKKDIAEVAVDHSSVGEGKLSKEELREVFKLKDVPCQTYLLMNGKKAGDGGESEVQAEDAVWREYEGWESICDDPLLKELVRESG